MPDALKNKLHARATLYRQIREFFAARDVLEVETPLLCSHSVTDVYIESIAAGERRLQTSPEYCMKRLLVAGSGSIYQICKAFRQEEYGTNHNPEFTMLEWYRVGFDHHQLMDELSELIQLLLQTATATKQSYRDCFIEYTTLDPFNCRLEQLHNFITEYQWLHSLDDIDYDTALQVIMSECIEPQIGLQQPHFVYDFPASQAALAKIRQEDIAVGERFELYYQGSELANGFHELTNADEQLERFKRDQQKRQALGLRVPSIDFNFIEALRHGLPSCAGVAVGLDRLLMLKTNSHSIKEVLSFAYPDC